MNLKIATTKTGTRYYFETRRMFGKVSYTADCASICYGPNAYKQTWHNTATEARKTAEERGTLEHAA